MTHPSYLVGIDCGTQSAKVVIFDATGTVISSGQQSLRPMSRPHPGVALHPDDDLWDAIAAASRLAMAGYFGFDRFRNDARRLLSHWYFGYRNRRFQSISRGQFCLKLFLGFQPD